jgi:type I restriction enzyme S subunit
MMNLEKPEYWECLSLEELLDFYIGGDWGKAPEFDDPEFDLVYCIRGAEIRSWELEKGTTASLRKVKRSSLIKRQLHVGDILVEISGGGPEQPVGRTVLIDKQTLHFQQDVPKICTNFLRLIRPSKDINSKFLNLFLKLFYHSGEVVNYQAGSNNLRNLKFPDFITIEIPLPPLPEQHRIVAKIEELFSELDKGIEHLKKAQAQLKVYRQAVLKAAFEGKLTEVWRSSFAKATADDADQLLEQIQSARQDHYEQQLTEWNTAVSEWEAGGKDGRKPGKPRKPKEYPPLTEAELGELPGLPEGWKWVRLGNLSTGVEYGSSKKSSETGKIPVIRMGNMQEGKIDWDDLVYTSDSEEIEKYLLMKGDVLFNRTNSPELVGKTVVYLGEQPAIFAGYLIRVNHFPEAIDSKLLNYFLNSYLAKNQGNKVKTDGVNQSNINGQKLSNYPIPLSTVIEQHQIVQEIESRLSVCDHLEQEIEKALQQSEALRQSILKKAFEGKLVPQDPNDEPATVLLERIKAERATKKK